MGRKEMKNWAETLNGYQVLFLGYQLWPILRTKPLDDLEHGNNLTWTKYYTILVSHVQER